MKRFPAICLLPVQVAGLGARAPQPILLQRLPTLALQVLLSTALVSALTTHAVVLSLGTDAWHPHLPREWCPGQCKNSYFRHSYLSHSTEH